MKRALMIGAALWALAGAASATITSPTVTVTDAGNGVTTVFNYGFLIPYQANGVTPAVTVSTCVAATLVCTPLSPNAYTITGVGNPLGGSVTYAPSGVPVPSGTNVVITRSLAYIQPTAVPNYSFYPHTVESVADNLEAQIQQIEYNLTNASAVGPVLSFNGRAGAVTLAAGDLVTPLSEYVGLVSSASSYFNANTTTDYYKFNVGGLPENAEVGGDGTDFSNFAVVVNEVIPSTTYTGVTAGWPDGAIAAHVLTNSTTKSGAGIYTLAGEGAPGGLVYGGNMSVVNCALFEPSCTSTTGMNFAVMYGLEVDTNVYGVGSAQPTGNSIAFLAVSHAVKQPVGDYTAFEVSTTGLAYKAAFSSNVGSAQIAVNAGPLVTGATSDSQPVEFTATKSGTAITGTVALDATGNLNLSPPAGGLLRAFGVTRILSVVYANLSTVDGTPLPGDMLVVSDASACTVNTAVVAGGGTTHSCSVVYNGAGWIALVTH